MAGNSSTSGDRRERGALLVAAVLLTAASLPAQPAPGTTASEYDQYGGYKGVSRRATGYFRVERIGGRWFFVTPEGHPYVALGANHIGQFFGHPTQPSRSSSASEEARQMPRRRSTRRCGIST